MHGLCGLDMDVLKQNRSDWCVNMRPARMQQWASKKRAWWERGTEQKRAGLENVPPWKCGQGNGLCRSRGTETTGSQTSAPRAGKSSLGWLTGSHSKHQGPYAFDSYSLS